MLTSKFFNMGKVVVTHGINEAMTENSRFVAEVNLSLQRYAVKDWGNLDDEDKQTNSGSLLIAYRKMLETMQQRYASQVRDNNGFCGLSNI